MPSDALLTNTPKEQLHALTRAGYDPKKIVYLPVDKDPQYGKAKSFYEAEEGSALKRMNVVNGLTLDRPGDTWETVATIIKDDPTQETMYQIAQAMSDWINENYSGDSNRFMQENAQYVNTYTINPGNETNLGVVAHESTHQGIKKAEQLADMDVKPMTEELLVRMIDVQTGTEDQAEASQKFIDEMVEEIRKKAGDKTALKVLQRAQGMLETLTTAAEQMEEGAGNIKKVKF